jgi:hypothetical protein
MTLKSDKNVKNISKSPQKWPKKPKKTHLAKCPKIEVSGAEKERKA